MRYVAHPVPDARLYASMIRACALAPESQAERALDLWTEMCVDNKVPPTRDTYNALILAYARASGNHNSGLSHSHEAFRYAREMLEEYRAGAGHLRPDTQTFSALLESVKRSGDLTRARWILAELVGAYTSDPVGAADLAPDDQAMAHIFQAYTSYNPTLIRRDVRTKKSASVFPQAEPLANRPVSSSLKTESKPPVSQEDTSARGTPQSHAEIVAEASILFERIYDNSNSPLPADEASPFHRVQITSHLLNSYISVHFAHSSLVKSRKVYEDIFSRPVRSYNDGTVRKNARTYMLALQRCAKTASRNSSSLSKANEALSFARALWDEWQRSNLENDSTVSPRSIEAVWRSMIRVLTL